MTGDWALLLAALEEHGRAVRVSVAALEGSAPREVGAAMVVHPDLGFRGTVGGGALEWRALRLAAAALGARDAAVSLHDVTLGPELGQCCGGRVTLAIEVFEASDLAAVRAFAAREAERPFATLGRNVGARLDRVVLDAPPAAIGLAPDGALIERFGDERRPLLLFGAGHLGRALVLALAPLPFRLDWIDGRVDAFPAAHPANAHPRRFADPVEAVAAAPADAFVLAVTHDHGLDFALLDAALRRDDLGWIGCVGSKSKRARFSSKFRELRHTDAAIRRMVMPIGSGGPRSKTPAAIAAAVAVELLIADEAVRDVRARRSTSSRASGVAE
ncbi:MAG: xanthine dehydrogenase accessory protein XdhC [Hyphomicrobiales bacterium]|nr:xanthine dehydrogenase accessory protein XdhC [Hyphomicrobiales bacterium]